jgi:hypothetical protein
MVTRAICKRLEGRRKCAFLEPKARNRAPVFEAPSDHIDLVKPLPCRSAARQKRPQCVPTKPGASPPTALVIAGCEVGRLRKPTSSRRGPGNEEALGGDWGTPGRGLRSNGGAFEPAYQATSRSICQRSSSRAERALAARFQVRSR